MLAINTLVALLYFLFRRNPDMTKKKGLILAAVIIMGLSYACSHDSNQGTNSKPNTTQSQEAKAPSKAEVSHNSDVSTEKSEIQKVVKELPNITDIDVMEIKDGTYSILFNVDVNTTDETVVRSNIVSMMQKIINSTKNKNYKIESINIIALYKKSPLGMYKFVSSEFSVSGTDEYSITRKGNIEKFMP